MRKLVWIGLVALAGCGPANVQTTQRAGVIETPSGIQVEKLTIDEHNYLLFVAPSGYGKRLAALHAADCWCQVVSIPCE